MKIKVKHNLIYDGRVYKKGEIIEVNALGYSFTWLTKNGWVEELTPLPVEDDLVAVEGLPALDEEPRKKGRKNE